MLPYLGPRLWADFVEHANRHYKEAWLEAFAPASGALRCVGLLDGTPCPHAVVVELGSGRGDGRGARGADAAAAAAAAASAAALEQLHLDHERPLHETCRWWAGRLPRAPRAWDDGLDGAALCHDLFGVAPDDAHGPPRVCFRCGPPRDASGRRARFVEHAYCHRS